MVLHATVGCRLPRLLHSARDLGFSARPLGAGCAVPNAPRPLALRRLPEEYHRECVRLVTRLHQWDVLRANKAPFAFGLETRVPFLDKQFLQVRHVASGALAQPLHAERLSLRRLHACGFALTRCRLGSGTGGHEH